SGERKLFYRAAPKIRPVQSCRVDIDACRTTLHGGTHVRATPAEGHTHDRTITVICPVHIVSVDRDLERFCLHVSQRYCTGTVEKCFHYLAARDVVGPVHVCCIDANTARSGLGGGDYCRTAAADRDLHHRAVGVCPVHACGIYS